MIVLTTLLTSTPDPQRGTTWPADPAVAETLISSCQRHDVRPYVLFDQPPISTPIGGNWAWVERRHPNPYVDRWNAYAAFLDGLPDLQRRQVWCVDASDVELLHPPGPSAQFWPAMESAGADSLVYGMAEHDTELGYAWLRDNHPSVATFDHPLRSRPLYNAGILGGNGLVVRDLARQIAAACGKDDLTDMAGFNRVLRSLPFVATGEPIHTRFRANEVDHPTAWWRHK